MGVLVLIGFGCGAAFGGCPGAPPVNRAEIFRVTNKPVQPLYIHSLSTAQIEGLKAVKLASRMLHEPGLTAAEQSLTTSYECGALENKRSHQFCMWAGSVAVDFSYTKMDVYISNQYVEGSCPYRVILGHENQHVSINNRALQKYLALMRRALQRDRTIPTKDRPISAPSFQSGQALIAARIERVVMPLFDRFKREVLAENRKIDTMQNYRRTQAKCREW